MKNSIDHVVRIPKYIDNKTLHLRFRNIAEEGTEKG